MPNWLQIALPIVSFFVSISALFVAFRNRNDARSDAHYKLKMEALLALQQCTILWQHLVNDLYHAKQELISPGVDGAISHRIVGELNKVETFVMGALKHSRRMLDREVLKLCEKNKLTLLQCREESTRKLGLLNTMLNAR